MLKQAHASYPYNPLIAEVLFNSSFLENWGSGVGRMVDACHAQGVPEPEYEVSGGFVRIVFKRSNPSVAQTDPNLIQSDPEVVQNDPEVVQAVYDLIKDNHSISRTALTKALGISERQVRKAIDALRDKRIKRKGGDSGEWEIIG